LTHTGILWLPMTTWGHSLAFRDCSGIITEDPIQPSSKQNEGLRG